MDDTLQRSTACAGLPPAVAAVMVAASSTAESRTVGSVLGIGAPPRVECQDNEAMPGKKRADAGDARVEPVTAPIAVTGYLKQEPRIEPVGHFLRPG
ncbi:hypothetical protein ACFYNW_36070 [Streptomyces virginiae]|uniref:hypothetical protein n=1 Tax=Streptomyces virginiae TaxID=1961 RepID=UPI0036EBA366